MWEFWLGYWWAVLIYGLAFGFVTKIVIKNKGYQEGKWFWWGFFFGVFALIVACTKPANVNASGQMSAVANSPLPQAVGLEKDYDTLYAIPERQYSIGSPIVINEGKLLKEKETGRIFAKCDFQIVTNRKIKAAFVSVMEYDVSGDYLEKTDTQYLDLDRTDGTFFGSDNQIALSNIVTRKIEIKCTKVIFADDTKWEAEGEWQQLPAKVSLSQSIGGDLAGQYKLEVNGKAQFNPQELDSLWICSCGCANHYGNDRCVHCGVQKTVVFGSLNQEELRRKYTERTVREQEAAKLKEAANKKRNKLLAIAAAVGVVILIISSIVSANQPGIKVVRMNEKRGSDAVVSSIDYLNHYFQLDFKVTGNFKGTVDLKFKITYPDGDTHTANWAWENVESGETCGVEWDSGFANVYAGHGEGTVKIDILNVETNKSIGTIKVRVK